MPKLKLLMFKIILTGTQQMYTPGSDVCGYCVIHLNGQMNLSELEIQLKGNASVYWFEGKNNISTSEQFLNLNYIHENFSNHSVLFGGEHQIPFRFHLPESIPSSYDQSNWMNGYFGSIKYRIKAKVRKPKKLSRNYKTQLPITIRSPANVDKRILMTHVSKKVGVFQDRGCVSLKCETNCGQFVGTDATIQCFAANRTDSAIILRAALKQRIYFIKGTHHLIKVHILMSVVGPDIRPNSSINECLTVKIPLDLPVVYNQCPLIFIDYQIVVTLDIPFAFDLRAKLPIIVTNQPF